MNQKDLKFEFEEVFRSDAADILAAREKARIMHHGQDIPAAGAEVEIAFRKVLSRKLPSLYYVGHGHIVDEQLHQSSQLDVIIANNTGAPILFRAENGSEYFPYEGVYAIGEVKSSYYKSEKYIHTFSGNLKKIQDKLQRGSFRAAPAFRLSPLPYGNPLFSFMFFADKGDFDIEQIRELYRTQPESELPNIVCILNKGVIVNVASNVWKNSQQNWEPAEQRRPESIESISLIPALNDTHRRLGREFHWILTEHGENGRSLGPNFANFYYLLIQHLQHCQLTVPNLTEYVNHLFGTTTATFIT